MKKNYILLFLIGMSLWLVQCETSTQQHQDTLFTRVRQMQKQPQQALVLLDSISKHKKLTLEERRKWKLLHFMYKYKADQSVKTDDYILDVRDYFIEKDHLPFYKGYAQYYAGIYYQEIAKREDALKQWFDLIPYAKTSKQLRLLAKIFYSTGRTYYLINNLFLAKSYYKKSLNTYRRANDSSGMSSCYKSLGNIYLFEKKTDSALHCYQLCLNIAQQRKDSLQMASVLQNIGVAYATIDNFKQQIKYLKQALPLQQSTEHIIRNHITLASGHYQLQQYDAANYYLQQIASRIHEIDNLYLWHNYYKTKAKLSIKVKDYEQAVNYFNTYTHLYDSITKQISNNQLLEVEKDHKRQLLEQELQATQKRQNIYYVVIFIGIVFTFLLLWSFHKLRNKNKTILESDRLLQQQKEETEKKARELEEKNQSLKQRNQEWEAQARQLAQQTQQLEDNNKTLQEEGLKSRFLFSLYKAYAAPNIDLRTNMRTYENDMLKKGHDFKKALDMLLKNLHKNRKKTKQLIEKEARYFLEELGFSAKGVTLSPNDYLYLSLVYCDYDKKDIMALLNTPSLEALAGRKFRVKTKLKEFGMPEHEIDKWLRNLNEEEESEG